MRHVNLFSALSLLRRHRQSRNRQQSSHSTVTAAGINDQNVPSLKAFLHPNGHPTIPQTLERRTPKPSLRLPITSRASRTPTVGSEGSGCTMPTSSPSPGSRNDEVEEESEEHDREEAKYDDGKEKEDGVLCSSSPAFCFSLDSRDETWRFSWLIGGKTFHSLFSLITTIEQLTCFSSGKSIKLPSSSAILYAIRNPESDAGKFTPFDKGPISGSDRAKRGTGRTRRLTLTSSDRHREWHFLFIYFFWGVGWGTICSDRFGFHSGPKPAQFKLLGFEWTSLWAS